MVWCRVDSIVIVPQLFTNFMQVISCFSALDYRLQHEAWGVISVDRCAEISSIASAQLPIMAESGEGVPESDAWSVQLTLHDEKWWRLRCLFLCSFPTAALFLPALMACFWFMVPWVTCSLWWLLLVHGALGDLLFVVTSHRDVLYQDSTVLFIYGLLKRKQGRISHESNLAPFLLRWQNNRNITCTTKRCEKEDMV